MQALNEIPGIGPRILKLLSAAGFEELSDIRGMSSSDLFQHLAEVNRHRALVSELPPESQLAEWIALASEIARIDFREDPDFESMLAVAPLVEAMNPQDLIREGVAPLSVPEPIYANAVPADVKVRFMSSPMTSRSSGFEVFEGSKEAPTAPEEKPEVLVEKAAAIDVSRVKHLNDYLTEDGKMETRRKQRSSSDERSEEARLVTTARKETNKGKNPKSRRFVRGVLHPLPGRMYLGALTSMMVILLLPLSILVGLALFLTDYYQVSPMSKWWLIIPGLLPVCGTIYLFVATSCRCRVCGQKPFVPKQCLKHRNAHRFPLLGYILPTSLHILLFKWFRCIFCGTSIRLKE